MSDVGPQRGPASAAQIQAQTKAVNRELLEYTASSEVEKPSCLSCRFYRPHDKEDQGYTTYGQCRRYPPQINTFLMREYAKEMREDRPDEDMSTLSVDAAYGTGFNANFPNVDHDDWCGEFRRTQ